MFKAARNQLVGKRALTKDDAPSYFIECLLYNIPDDLFAPKLAPAYTGILAWLKTAKLKDFQCQNGLVPLFGRQRDFGSPGRAGWFGRITSRRSGTSNKGGLPAPADIPNWTSGGRLKNVPTPSPYYMNLAAKLYDTYARVPISDALSIGAQQMQEMAGQLRAARDGHTQEAQVANFITWAIQHRVFAGYAGVGGVPYDDLLMVARKHDPRAFEGFPKAALRRALSELFPGATSARRISIKALTGAIPMNTSDNSVERT